MSPNPVRLVCVVWNDAHGNAFAIYEPQEIPHAAAKVYTYGIVIREDEAGISMANESFEGGSYRGVTFIPRGMIIEVRDLQSHKTRKPRAKKETPSDGTAHE